MMIDLSQMITADSKAEAARSSVRAGLADLRWQHETGGVVLPGIGRVDTRRDTQARLTGLVQALEAGLIAGPVAWKTEAGWVDLDANALREMARAVAVHVQDAYRAERAVLDLLERDVSGDADLGAAFKAALRPQG